MAPSHQLISHYVHCQYLNQMWSNWRTDNDELDVHSDHLPITFNIIASNWSTNKIEKQKIETWNLRSDNWNLYRQILKTNLEKWKISLFEWFPDDPDLLDNAVETWTNCVVDAANRSIGTKTVWKGNKPWWSDYLHRKRKRSMRLKKEFRKYRTTESYQAYKQALKNSRED